MRVDATVELVLTAENAAGATEARSTVTLVAPTDTAAPIITHVPIVTTQPVGQAVTIEADVVDVGSGLAAVRVHYRVAGNGSFRTSTLQPNGSTYSIAIAGNEVRAPGIEYYLEAEDDASTANIAYHPAGAPAETHAFVAAVADTTPPVLTHMPVASGRLEGSDVEVAATAVDAGSGVGAVTLYWRALGASSFATLSMQPGAADVYTVTLAGAQIQAPGIEYYLRAVDGATPSNSASSPAAAPSATHSFTVSPLDTDPPTIVHAPLADDQTAGAPVTVTAQATDAGGIQGATLFYRTEGAGPYASTAMALQAGLYRGSIPGVAVVEPALQYYIEVEDRAQPAANVARAPGTAPATPHRFTVITVDTNSPLIELVAVPSPQPPGASVLIEATLADASGVGAVTLFHRRIGTTAFAPLTMTAGAVHRATLPASSVVLPGVEYYIEAADLAQPANIGRLPAGAPAAVSSFEVGHGETATNDTAATADPLLPAGLLENVGIGAIAPTGDRDWWFVDVPTGGFYNLTLEVTSGGQTSCPAPIDTVLRVYAGDATSVLASDSFDGIGSCSRIDPAIDGGVRALAPGRIYVRIEESGDNAVIGRYEIRARLDAVECGNGILELPAQEQCDDGNTAANDGCSPTCAHEVAASVNAPGATLNGSISPAPERDLYAVNLSAGQNLRAETHDGQGGCPGDTVLDLVAPDGVTVLGSDDDDGIGTCSAIEPLIDTFAASLGAGRYFVRVRSFGGNTVINGYRLEVSITDALCGDANVEATEQCDDGNTTSGDGCSASCQWEIAGVAAFPGGAFTNAISPIGSVDFYQITIAEGQSLRAETFSPNTGGCDDDTVLRLWASDRSTQVATDDQDGIGDCSLLDPLRDLQVRAMPAGTYFLGVEEFGNNRSIAQYTLDLQILPAGCGNGFIEIGEACDDGNTLAMDGCSPACAIEGVAELEPNDTAANATPLITATASISARIRGVIPDATDVDLFSVLVPEGAHLIAEISDGLGGCPVATSLRLRDVDGTTSLVFDGTDGPGACGRIAPGLDAAARTLAAGTYFLEVRAGVGSSAVYTLDARVAPANSCGNLFLDPQESCDDGNTTSLDGCSASCAFDVLETEANGTAATADVLVQSPSVVGGVVDTSGDEDWYAVDVPAGASLVVHTHAGARDQCEAPIDTVVHVYDATGTNELASDDDGGVGLCSRIERAELADLAAGTYFVRVRPYAAGIIYDYGLTIEVR